MAKPEAILTIVRGTPREPRNYTFSYVSKLDEILIEDTTNGNSMRITYSQLKDLMFQTDYVRSKYRND